MDPLTQILAIIQTILKIHEATLNAMDPPDRAAYGKMMLEDMQRWRDFFDFFRPK